MVREAAAGKATSKGAFEKAAQYLRAGTGGARWNPETLGEPEGSFMAAPW